MMFFILYSNYIYDLCTHIAKAARSKYQWVAGCATSRLATSAWRSVTVGKEIKICKIHLDYLLYLEIYCGEKYGLGDGRGLVNLLVCEPRSRPGEPTRAWPYDMAWVGKLAAHEPTLPKAAEVL
jgi:hypothetical protein